MGEKNQKKKEQSQTVMRKGDFFQKALLKELMVNKAMVNSKVN